ncbi:MAG: hypothetical protein GY936_19330 [Ignavibacteriae bacterium]|nr:hypothetical protein [Ignavibacteriota bacterium]
MNKIEEQENIQEIEDIATSFEEKQQVLDEEKETIEILIREEGFVELSDLSEQGQILFENLLKFILSSHQTEIPIQIFEFSGKRFFKRNDLLVARAELLSKLLVDYSENEEDIESLNEVFNAYTYEISNEYVNEKIGAVANEIKQNDIEDVDEF